MRAIGQIVRAMGRKKKKRKIPWKRTSESTRPCPCGKGTYLHRVTVSQISNYSESGYEEQFVMQCPACRKAYRKEPRSFAGTPPGDRWMRVEDAKELDRLEVLIFKKLDKVGSMFERRYRRHWLSYFKKLSLKETWSTLTAVTGLTGSFSRFSTAAKRIGLERVLVAQLRPENFPKILTLLKRKDPEILSRLAELKVLNRKERRAFERARKHSVPL